MFNNWEELENNFKKKIAKDNIIFDEGNRNANIMIIGRSEIKELKEEVEAFFEAQDISKTDYYFTNIYKYENKEYLNEELKEGISCLINQIMLVNPKVIVLLGEFVLQTVLWNKNLKIDAERGKIHKLKNIDCIATYGFEEIQEDKNKKLDFWKDFIFIKEKSGK